MSESALSSTRPELVLGTWNRKKGAELAELLAPWGFQVQTLVDVPGAIDVAETGNTFAANAALKAIEQARHLGRWVLADDSGLEVEPLGGAPGVFSARFAGQGASDEENNLRLLQELQGVASERRTARYVCHVTLADPAGRVRAESCDVCRGRIRDWPAGTNGFGYDPLFEVVEYHRTFGELGPRVKRALSHRSRALRAILPRLIDLADELADRGTLPARIR